MPAFCADLEQNEALSFKLIVRPPPPSSQSPQCLCCFDLFLQLMHNACTLTLLNARYLNIEVHWYFLSLECVTPCIRSQEDFITWAEMLANQVSLTCFYIDIQVHATSDSLFDFQRKSSAKNEMVDKHREHCCCHTLLLRMAEIYDVSLPGS